MNEVYNPSTLIVDKDGQAVESKIDKVEVLNTGNVKSITDIHSFKYVSGRIRMLVNRIS